MKTENNNKSHEELKKMAGLYHLLVENSPDAIGVIVDRKIAFLNKPGLRLFGYTKDEVIGKDISELVHPEDIEMVLIHIETVLSEGCAQPIEYRLLTKNGEIIHVETARCKIEYEGKSAVQCIVRDISYKKRLDKEIKELENRYKSLVEDSPDAIGVIYNGRIVFCNNKTIELLGYTYDEIHGKGVIEFIYPEDRERVSKNLMLILSGATLPSPREYKLIKKNGEYIDVELTSSKVEYGGKPAIQGVMRDVSERKKRDAMIREMEERYRSIVEGSPDGIAVACDGRIVFANKRCSELLGYSTEELIGKSPLELINPEDREKLINNMRAILSGESLPSLTREYRVIKKDGEIIDVDAISRRITYEDKPAIQSIFRDITGRKKRESEIKEYIRQLEILNKIAVDRELRMIELKKEANELLHELGRDKKYQITE